MASTEPPQPLKNKTCVLRVSIHCEGCKRKVTKILKSIPGVHDIQIQRQIHRVVVTGDVSPESLVRKLVKSGKHAELWPENHNPVQNYSRKTENLTGDDKVAISGKEIKPPTTKSKVPTVETAVSGKEIKPPATKKDIPVVDSSEVKDPVVKSGVAPAGNGGGKVVEDGGKVAGEVKVEEKKPETGSASDGASPAVDKKNEQLTGDDGGVIGGSGGEEKKKRKKKKEKEGQNGNLDIAGEASSSAAPPETTTRSSNQSPPRHHGYKYPAPYHHAPPQAAPVYTVSYNTAHPPVNSYTASYYPAAPPQSYAYSHYGSAMAPPQPPSPPPLSVPSDYYESYGQQPVDSFEMFSDENPNGCLIM